MTAIAIAVGLLALYGAAIRFISRKDPTPPEERRVPAGRSGVCPAGSPSRRARYSRSSALSVAVSQAA